MTITAEEIAREKDTLPFGWGRFGKAMDRLADVSAPDESLLAACVGLNPEYRYKAKFVPGTALGAGHALNELMTKSTNVLLACTNERLLMISTGAGGGPRDEVSIPYDGMEIVSQGKKEFVLGLPEGEMRVRGAAKQQVPRFLEVLATRIGGASASPA